MLIDRFREMIGKDASLGQESLPMPNFSSGFDLLDYYNGSYAGEDSVITGLEGGKIITFIGKSGTGKTTLAIQTGCNIVDKYEQSQMIHLDFERATNINRIKTITGWSDKKLKQKYIHMNRHISTESAFKLIKAIADVKLQEKDSLEIPSGMYDDDGNEIMMLPPTVVLIDSLAVMAPNKIEEDSEMGGSMTASAIAKANTQLFKRIVSPLMDANIILIVVNHINAKIEINPMVKTQAQVNFLKPDETLPGGNAPIYLSNYIFKLVASKKLEPDKEYGIKGFEVVVELIKSRSAAAGLKFTLVFDQANGFDNLLSNYVLLKDNKLIKGAGRGYYLESCPDVKFSQKTFKEKYYENEELRKAFDSEVKRVLMGLIPEPEADFEDDLNPDSFTWNEEYEVYIDKNGNCYDSNYEPVTLYDEDGNEIEFEV